MSRSARAIHIGACVVSLTASPAVLGQGSNIPAAARPHLAAYADCAKAHLERQARKDPTTTFERIEGSLRPACGLHVELAREALFRNDFSPSEANAVIRNAYASLQPEFRAKFAQAASAEKDRKRLEQERAQPIIGKDAVPREQLDAMERERSKYLKEASDAYDHCLVSEVKSLVPASSEPAETLTKVIEIKCAEQEKRVMGLGVAFYGASPTELQTIVKDPLEERKKRLVADIVTLKADLAKEAAKPREAPETGASADPATQAPVKKP